LEKYSEIENLKKELSRETLARKEAESFIESKSLELYESNAKLLKLNETLEDEIKKKTNTIKEKEKQFKDLIENATDIIFTINIHGFFTYVNPVAEKISGYSAVELLEMNFVNLIRADYKEDVTEHYFNQLHQKSELTNIQFPIINKQNELIWIHQKARLIIDENGPKEFVVISRDVTEIKAADELFMLSEEKYRGIIENLKLGILEVDNDDKIIKAYPQFCSLVGYSEEELIGRSAIDLFLDEEFKQIMEKQNKERLKGKSGVYEVPLLKKNGGVAWTIISGAPFYGVDGKSKGTIGIHLDISERRKMESDLRDANLKAEELNRVKEIFLANMSHEIRTPMNAIVGMAELLEQTNLDKPQSNYLSAISSSSKNLLVLINDLLDFSKINSGNLSLEMGGFNLNKLITKTIEAVSLKADINGVDVIAKVDKNLPLMLKGDSTRLGQVLLNLLSNAVKFTTNGSVVVSVNLVQTKAESYLVKFEVKDDGIGIPEEELLNIFKDFSQAKDSTSRFYGGTGLGLSISQKIIRLMDGELEVNSELNKGSEFFFSIELEDLSLDNSDKESIDNYEIINNFNQRIILLVEDNPVNSLMAITILEKWNFRVDLAENGIEAIEKLKIESYDLILMDMTMPKMGGIEASGIIRTQLKIDTPIIALTANAINGDSEKCLNSGMNDYLSKPYLQIDLNKVISKWIQPSDNTLVNLSKLEEMGDPQFLEKMVDLFLVETQKDISLLKEAIETSNFEQIRLTAHKIKPSINYVCISRLFDEVKAIEICEDDNVEYLEKTKSFIYDLEIVLDQLRQLK
jgi:PAS domain S-box-containing protein